jgi:hypothetical protein
MFKYFCFHAQQDARLFGAFWAKGNHKTIKFSTIAWVDCMALDYFPSWLIA